MKKILIGVTLAALSANAMAFGAGDVIDTSSTYMYAGIGQSDAPVVETASMSKPKVLSLAVGANLKFLNDLKGRMPGNFALEGGYRHFTKSTAFLPSNVGGTGNTITSKVDMIGLQVVYAYPIPKLTGLNVIGKVGVSLVRASLDYVGDAVTPHQSGTGVFPNIGLGVEYKLTDAIAVRALVEKPGNLKYGTGAIGASPTVISAGATYHF